MNYQKTFLLSNRSIDKANSLLEEYPEVSKKIRRRFDIEDEEFALYFLASYFDDKINDFIIGVEGHSHQYMKYIEIAKKQGYNKEQCGIIGRNKLFESLKRLFKDINSLLRQENIKNTIDQINIRIHKSTDTLICNGLISENDITTKNRITKLFKICFIRSMVSHFYLLQKENFIRKIAIFTRENNSLDEIISLSLKAIKAEPSMIRGYMTDAYEEIVKILCKTKEDQLNIKSSINNEVFILFDKNFLDLPSS